jgi:hypothetical protein
MPNAPDKNTHGKEEQAMTALRMATGWRRDVPKAIGFSRSCLGKTFAIAVASGFVLGVGPALARPPCSAKASVQFEACKSQVNADFFTANALCLNVLDKEEQKACIAEAKAGRAEDDKLCGKRRAARQDLCAVLGEGPYDPHFAPALFDTDFTHLTHPNPYAPLTIGNRWEFVDGQTNITIEVLNKTKLIEGVTCIVSHDRAEEDGKVIEDTDDWFGQRKDGTVDYCGESTLSFETFAGDVPEEPELVDIHGSWKAGRGALPGTFFPGSPTVGVVYRQEFSPGVAEDIAQVLSTSYGFGSDPELDKFVPQDLAQLLCSANNCVVTRESSPNSPGDVELKYYTPGIGFFLALKPLSGKVGDQLVNCNFDARCAALPQP